MHVGITPKYRGVHGGYWALANQDKDNCGVTVHFIDKGIDTGEVISQARINPDKKDNFTTYPLLQQIKGIELMKKVIRDIAENNIETFKPDLESKLWTHPTMFNYLFNRVFKGVK